MYSVRFRICILIWCLVMGFQASAQDDLNVISGEHTAWLKYTDSKNALYHHFASEAYELLEQRRSTVASYQSIDDWKQRQRWIKETLAEIVGPFPERTPLNARVVRRIDKETYRIEHVIFESQPQFYVTSSLYIPKALKRREKAPAVIYCSGHAAEGYRSNVYQHVILNLVNKGFVVFAFDPVGQGERLEYLDQSTGKSFAGGPTSEHSYPGTQAFITGSSQARYMIWDGIRAVDYLLTRPEVDAARIGITGRSGGGTQSAYIAAFDERILAAAPECYITNFTRLLESIGPQDAEQNFPAGIAKGIDHSDLLIVRAPKPTLMITTTRDMFSIQGARETAAEVSGAYKAYNAEANFGMVEDDAPHASTKKNREAMYAFFRRHLSNPGNATDEDIPIPGKEELQVTATGQVSTSLGGETVYSLNREEAESVLRAHSDVQASDFPAVVEKAKLLSGFRKPTVYHHAAFTGRIQRDGYVIEKYFVKGEGDYVIPFLLLTPQHPTGKTVLYLHPKGKSAEAAPDGELEQLAKKGFVVVAPDLVGTGEMGPGDFKGDAFMGGVSHNIWYASVLLGRSIAGLHAGDIDRVLHSLESLQRTVIIGVACKEMSSAMLHAAAFNSAIQKIALIEPLTSFQSLVGTRQYYSPFIVGAVAGGLKEYDLPALAASLAPRELLIINPLDGSGEKADSEKNAEGLALLQSSYGDINGKGKLTITEEPQERKLRALLLRWLEH